MLLSLFHCLVLQLSGVGLFAGEVPPCPIDASLWDCDAWCKKAAPKSQARYGGGPCAHRSAAQRKAGAGPICSCYGDDEEIKAECQSKCPDSEDDGQEVTFDPASEVGGVQRRFLLYDVKMGEGFNLQREIFPRVGKLLHTLNERVKAICRGKLSAGRCSEWTLVLPPWCYLAHWRTNSTKVPWRKFFDSEALQSAKVNIIEFDEYSALVGKQRADIALHISERRIAKDQRYGRVIGGFSGWSRDLTICTSKTPDGRACVRSGHQWRLAYSGQCDGGLEVSDCRCGVVSSTQVQDFANVVLSAAQDGNVTSVILPHMDSLSPPSDRELDDLNLREAMLYAKPIRKVGEHFINEVLGGRPYLAAHVRRTDFAKAHPKTTPDLVSVFRQLEEAAKTHGLEQIYLATDDPEEVASELRLFLGQKSERPLQLGAVGVFMSTDWLPSTSHDLDHIGQRNLLEMWICARATRFMGTQNSRYSLHIMLERSWLGKSKESSEVEFCATADSRRLCKSSFHRNSRKGSQHKEHWEL